jgi:hypothetical protein
MCGDADTTGSVCGQIAGAIYGFIVIEIFNENEDLTEIESDTKIKSHTEILGVPNEPINEIKNWDNYEIIKRAMLMFEKNNKTIPEPV